MLLPIVVTLAAQGADTFENASEDVCDATAVVHADEQTASSWIATEVPRASDTADVERISYTLIQETLDDGTVCDASLSHEVSVYVMDDDQSELLEQLVTQVKDVDDDGTYSVMVSLADEISLDEDDRLFVAVRSTGDAADGLLCMQGGDDCEDGMAQSATLFDGDTYEVKEEFRPRVRIVISIPAVCGDLAVTGGELCDPSADESLWDSRCAECDSDCVCTALYNPDWDEQAPELPEYEVPERLDPGPY